jgi:hypothetical protein
LSHAKSITPGFWGMQLERRHAPGHQIQPREWQAVQRAW